MCALIRKLQSPVVFCHNDTTAGNLIYREDEGMFVAENVFSPPPPPLFFGGNEKKRERGSNLWEQCLGREIAQLEVVRQL